MKISSAFTHPLLPAAAAATPAHSRRKAMVTDDLPWSELKLSSNAVLVDTNPEGYIGECYPPPDSMYDMIAKDSGLCMQFLYNGFENGIPILPDEGGSGIIPIKWWETFPGFSDLFPEGFSDLYTAGTPLKHEDETVQGWLVPSNPGYNLPPKVLFPAVAGDVAAAVKFAKENNLELSVKNSGAEFKGQSTKKNTLLINMNKFKLYAQTGVEECSVDSSPATSGEFMSDLSDQPCRLAISRGKTGVIRVGGGENFDKLYRAVHDYNENYEKTHGNGYRYHVVGGGIGLVSPMGWTWMGGLSGTTAGRAYGFGVDQVLRIDMVLPNGYHVRFGPTEWENDNGFIYPKTKAVSGACHQNPEEEDEGKWIWASCPEDTNINFADLWFAVRGGGGGSWGVVTSVILQLHDYFPLEVAKFNTDNVLSIVMSAVPTNSDVSVYGGFINEVLNDFAIDFFLDPGSVGIDDEDLSKWCGTAATAPLRHAVNCYKEGAAEVMVSAWKNWVDEKNKTWTDEGIAASLINGLAEAFDITILKDSVRGDNIVSEGPHAGKLDDIGSGATYGSSSDFLANIILPESFILENKDVVLEYYRDAFAVPYYAFGGNAGIAHDQMTSLSEPHRGGGTMILMDIRRLDDKFYSEVLPKMYDTSDPTNFPGFIGTNHAGIHVRGPLKADWTKACPLDWTIEERDEKCVSLQKAIWGTKMLSRLEGIKKAVDPDFMFNCTGCIGNNRAISATVEATPAPKAAPSTATNLCLSLIPVAALVHVAGVIFTFLLWT